MLSQNQLQNVCLLGRSSNECRYLSSDPMDWTKFICKKKSPEKKVIDEEVALFLKECKDKGVKPESVGEPIGNNCDGFLPLQNLLQGYDVKKKK